MERIANLNIDEKINLNDKAKEIVDILNEKEPVNYFCNKCGCIRTFNRIEPFLNKKCLLAICDDAYIFVYDSIYSQGDKIMYKESSVETTGKDFWRDNCFYFFYHYKCPNCKNILTQIFFKNNDTVRKIYQSEEMELISPKDIKIFKKLKYIDDEYLSEFNKAIKLDKQGFHIGAYTYLRRIYENISYNIYQINKDKIILPDNKEYESLKNDDIIKLINPYLPILGSKEQSSGIYKNIYSILSETIHNLSEDIASKYCKLMIQVLSQILEKIREMQEDEKRIKDILIVREEIFKKEKQNKVK